jgi:hypothetical protein
MTAASKPLDSKCHAWMTVKMRVRASSSKSATETWLKCRE